MKDLKIGDRVRVYQRSVFTGTVTNISSYGHINVTEDGFYSLHNDSPFHRNQCRRLRPKKKPREFWIRFDRYKQPVAVHKELPQKQRSDEIVTHVREVRERKGR